MKRVAKLAVVSSAWLVLLTATSLQAAPLILDLADIVGGGNGTGTGTDNTGINPRSGLTVVGITSTNNPGTPNIFSTVVHPFIDGVFVPDGGAGLTPITSTGITAALPDTDSNSWENGIGSNAACCGGNLRIAGVTTNMFAGANSGIGFHANKGITFDLNAIRAAYPNYSIDSFSAVVDANVGSGATVSFFTLLDGVLVDSKLNMLDDAGNALPINISIGASNRFLTFVGTDSGNGYGNDQMTIGNPQLSLSALPEPTSVAMWIMIAFGLTACGLRRKMRRAVR